MTTGNMSDAEAKAEHDDIQAEIAREKGIAVEKPAEAAEVPAKGDEPENDEVPADEAEELPEEEKPDVDPAIPPKDFVPLRKFQDTKKTLEDKVGTLESKVQQLTQDLATATTSKDMQAEIKAFSEKHGMAEDAALDLVQLVLDKVKPTEALSKVENFIKKQEIDEKFQSEFDSFVAESPEAADRANEIKALAFKEEYASMSLYEIFHRFVKPTEKKKTGESSRTTRAAVRTGFDPKAVIEKLKANTPGAMDGLTPEQQDQVFETMEKTGSRYNNRG